MRKCRVCGYSCSEKEACSWVKHDICSMSCVKRARGIAYKIYKEAVRRIR